MPILQIPRPYVVLASLGAAINADCWRRNRGMHACMHAWAASRRCPPGQPAVALPFPPLLFLNFRPVHAWTSLVLVSCACSRPSSSFPCLQLGLGQVAATLAQLVVFPTLALMVYPWRARQGRTIYWGRDAWPYTLMVYSHTHIGMHSFKFEGLALWHWLRLPVLFVCRPVTSCRSVASW